jgi:hypothetical protein
VLEHARDRFATSLASFKPWHGVNGITERNLTFQVAASFLQLIPESQAFMEVAFRSTSSNRTDRHLDGYLLSPELAVIVEAKIVYRPQHVSWISADIERMSTELIEQLQARHPSTRPRSTHGLVLAETWNPEIVAWWHGEDGARPRWVRDRLIPVPFRDAWSFNSLEVYRSGPSREGTLHWLYATSPDLAPLAG